MNRRKTSAGLTIAALALCFGGPGYSSDDADAITGASPVTGYETHAGWQLNQEQHGEKLTAMADELGLTAQQRSDIQIITGDYAARFKDIAKLGRDTAAELMQMAPDDPAYRDRTSQASALAAASAAELVVLLAEMRAKLYLVLTPEQRDQVREKIQALHDSKEQAANEPAGE
jgi:Spy/CpxP family protein refolding chaperone